eukprot:gnl/Spiro4/3408_TR1655_c0_g1_i1.p1 gnl/Spiro4/3408_TR1655_c0_g1~~gnl/Spiro4/3408_TR1655_c0_g1_i1.p1  ORF type:complete len:162 (+),score=25.57 gnl/Spiro4/3408_TR1655_c0_g1_i1:70-555(+)
MSGPGVGESPFMNSPPDSLEELDNRAWGLRPVTIAQIRRAPKPSDESTYFWIDGHFVSQVSVVARLLRELSPAASTVIVVSDGTGQINVHTDANIPSSAYYVRILGTLHQFHSLPYISAFHIRPVVDYNEITYHLLDVIRVHLWLTRTPFPFSGLRRAGIT